MNLQLTSNTNSNKLAADCAVVFVSKNLGKEVTQLTEMVDHHIVHGGMECKEGELTFVVPTEEFRKCPSVLLVGLGDESEVSLETVRNVVSKALSFVNGKKFKKVKFFTEGMEVKDAEDSEQIKITETARIAEELNYTYTETKEQKEKPVNTKIVYPVEGGKNKANGNAQLRGASLGGGVNCAKYLGELPSNICTPDFLVKYFADYAKTQPNLKFKALTQKQLEKLGMHSMLSVAKGSNKEPRLLIAEYTGIPKSTLKSKKPHVLIGKGVTFDAGGISLKPGAGMEDMKFDMGGAAAVLGTMKAIVDMKLRQNVVAIVGAVENMPSENATKPGDVVTSMSGKTIEIKNTDAEGRLVLCDCIEYSRRYDPKSVIDVATLTGAVIVALGSHRSAVYTHNDDFAAELIAAGEKTDDLAWRMPLDKAYAKSLETRYADISNLGSGGAGSITAAKFLDFFAEDLNWAHIDCAGSAFKSSAGTGRPVKLLTQYLIDSDK